VSTTRLANFAFITPSSLFTACAQRGIAFCIGPIVASAEATGVAPTVESNATIASLFGSFVFMVHLDSNVSMDPLLRWVHSGPRTIDIPSIDLKSV
jgi:hypothetical protein